MLRLGFAEFRLNCDEGVLITIEERLEVSLDCSVCRRRRRTIVFEKNRVPGYCSPTGHEFPGYVTAFSSLECGGRYEFQYQYDPFTDVKHPDELRYQSFEKGAPSWVRVYFVTQCSKCHRRSRENIQTNLVRPWRSVCRCGAPLFADVEEPRLSWSQAAS